MLSSVTYQVQFRVEEETHPGELVFIVGNCQELGNWEPQRAVRLRKGTQLQNGSDGGTRNGNQTEKREVWSKTVSFSDSSVKKYRYFVGHLLVSDDEDEDKHVIVSKWETNIQPRIFSPQDAAINQTGVDIAKFGTYDGSTHVSSGWLMDQSYVCINLQQDPIKMWNYKTRGQIYSIKCTAIDHKNAHDDDEDTESSVIPAANSLVTVSVLGKGRSHPYLQDKFGALYTPNCYMSFNIQTMDPEHTGFQFDFYRHDGYGDDSQKDYQPKHIGCSFILPVDLKMSQKSRKVPINSLKHKPLGELKFDYVFVKPLLDKKFDMEVSYQNFWKSSRKPLDIGHRGMGVSHGQANPLTQLAPVPENTIQSLKDAASHGADFVEFDVMLTKDKEVIVFHNFQVHISYKKKKEDALELITIPIHELKLADLKKMKVWHSPDPNTEANGSHKEDTEDPEDLQPFPTLQRCFETVDCHTGFNIEIKYPQEFKDGQHEQKHFTDLNEFVDGILNVVLNHHGGRRIIFSCFHPDVCIALNLKQNRFPVLFLTQADTATYTHYEGIRTQSIHMATEFCLSHRLLGIAAMSEVLLRDQSLIDYVKDKGLVLFCWGEDNNNLKIINMLKQKKLDGMIYDRIDHFKTEGKESIFKLEHRMKLPLLDSDSEPITINIPV